MVGVNLSTPHGFIRKENAGIADDLVTAEEAEKVSLFEAKTRSVLYVDSPSKKAASVCERLTKVFASMHDEAFEVSRAIYAFAEGCYS